MMKINVANLREGLHRVQVEGNPKGLMTHGNFLVESPIHVEAKIDKRSNDINLECEIRVSALFNCDKCLESFNTEIDTRFNLYLTSRIEETHNSDVRYWNQNQPYIDITDEVHDALILSVPIKAICDTGCKGLCPVCGINLNKERCTCTGKTTDPRWEKLKELRDSQSSDTFSSAN